MPRSTSTASGGMSSTPSPSRRPRSSPRMRHGIGSREAFEMLVKVSQHTNVKLRDVASDFVSTRKLPAT
ncbi:ANTAR domain-containing protein [Streptomyces sp. HNM0575]|nr:ANTAR domain-containing protein [Streptomyces sp. HNM0575]